MSETQQTTSLTALPGAEELQQTLRQALSQVMDPEAGMNIVDLGLIYRLEVTSEAVEVDITMTSPACPLGEMIMDQATAALRTALPAGLAVDMKLVWSPPWEPARMSDHAKVHFGW